MKPRRFLVLLLSLLLPAALGRAQTATWIAPGNSTSAPQDWLTGSNWDLGIPPAGPTAVAAIPIFSPGQLTLPSVVQPGGAPLLAATGLSIGEIRYLTPNAQFTMTAPGIQFGIPTNVATTFDLTGAGFTRVSTTGFFITPRVDVVNATLTFHNQAAAVNNNFVLSAGATIVFADQSSAGTSSVGFGTPGGRLIVRDTADISRVVVNGSGLVDISGATQDVAVTAINNGIDLNLGANRIVFDRLPNNTITFLSGKISGTGGISFTSATNSVLVITNPANDYTGETLIASNPARAVFSGGAHVNNVRVANNALVNIGTTATVTGRLNLESGRLQISDNGAAATLTVQGDYTQGTGSELTVNSVFFPSLVITGTATLAGRLSPVGLPASASVGSARFKLISAGQIIGRFDPLAAGFGPGLTRSVQFDYTNTEVALVVTQLPFADAGTTPSQRAAGANLDANLPTATGPFRSLLVVMNNFTSGSLLAAGLGELSPDTYGTLVEEGFTAAAAAQARLDARLARLRSEPAEPGFGIFAEGHTRQDRFAAIAGLWDNNYRTSGATAGVLWRAPGWSAGLAASRQTGGADLDPFGSHASVKDVTAGFFVQHATGKFFQNASVGYTASDFTLRRRVIFPGVNQTALASPAGSRTDYAFTAGYAAGWGHWRLTPAAGLLGSHWQMDDFTETGATFTAITFHGWSANSLRSRASVQAAYEPPGARFRPHVDVTWLHEFEDDRSIPAQLGGSTTGYISPGRPAETDLVQASLALDCRLGRSATLSLNLGGGWGRNSRVASDVNLGLGWQF